jgi:hypothetical protein
MLAFIGEATYHQSRQQIGRRGRLILFSHHALFGVRATFLLWKFVQLL